MATSPTGNKDVQGDLSDIKRKLVWRMGFAALMIVALLGGLALFDYLGARIDTDPGEPQFTEPVPVPKKTVTQPVTPAEPAKEEKSVPEASAAPVDKSAPVLDAPPRPEVAEAIRMSSSDGTMDTESPRSAELRAKALRDF